MAGFLIKNLSQGQDKPACHRAKMHNAARPVSGCGIQFTANTAPALAINPRDAVLLPGINDNPRGPSA
jgi:hypothetical protein